MSPWHSMSGLKCENYFQLENAASKMSQRLIRTNTNSAEFMGKKFFHALLICLCLQSKDKLPFWQNGTGEAKGWQHGWHGYDNEFLDMRGFLLAQGPGKLQKQNYFLILAFRLECYPH